MLLDTFPCDYIKCPTCNGTGKFNKTMSCLTCLGKKEIPHSCCPTCEQLLSACTCPIPCGKPTTHLTHLRGHKFTICGKPSSKFISNNTDKQIRIFDVINCLSDLFRCKECTANSVTVHDTYEVLPKVYNCGILRQEAITEFGDDAFWKLGYLWQGYEP